MTSQNFRILPLMIIVAMLAFSVRIADVAVGFSSLSGEAQAQNDSSNNAAAGKSIAEQIAERAGEELETAPKTNLAEETTTTEESGLNVTQLPEVNVPDVEWRDAADQEIEYSNVRLEMFDDLSARRKTLEKREKELMTREALLRAAEQEIDRKYQELSGLRAEIEGLLQQQSEEEQARITSLVKIYEGMKPKDAARIFDTLDLDILVEVMSKMSERKLSPILAAMNPERARTITIMLAEQKKLPELPFNQ